MAAIKTMTINKPLLLLSLIAVSLGYSVRRAAAEAKAPLLASVMQTLAVPELFARYGLKKVRSFEETPWGGLAFVSDDAVRWSKGWKTLVFPPAYAKSPTHVRMIAFLPGGGLVGVSGNRLAAWSHGIFVPIGKPLPNDDMQIARNPKDPKSLFVYGGKGKGANGVFLFHQGRLKEIIRAPGPLTAFTATGRALYFAVGPVVYRQRPNHVPLIIFRLGKGIKDVVSIAVDERARVLYAATEDDLMAADISGLSKQTRGYLVSGYGGEIRVLDKRLYLLDHGTGALLSFPKVPPLPQPKKAQPAAAEKKL